MIGTIYYPDHYNIGLDWLYLLLCSKWPRTPRTDLVIRWKKLKPMYHMPMHTTHRFRRNKIKVVKQTLLLSKSSLLFWFFHQTKYTVPLTFAMPKIHQAWIHWRIRKMLGTIHYPEHYNIGLDWLYLLLCSKWPRTPRTDLVIRWKK